MLGSRDQPPLKLKSSKSARKERMSLIRSIKPKKKKREEPEELVTRTDIEVSAKKETLKSKVKKRKKKRLE